jgi:imidazole glycerol-phosphate synthase subunit HisH
VTRVAILDYGMGNLRSVEKALERVGAQPEITADAERARDADGVVLPGVGAFPPAIARVRELGFDELISDRINASVPVLGVCLGMQLLFERSTEQGGAEGLGVFSGEVRELRAPGLKLPHIGWEPVTWLGESELVEGIPSDTPFYFVHSFVPDDVDETDVLGVAAHGERFVCAVGRDRVWGFQCHPEKSSDAGLRILANFVRASDAVADAAEVPAGSGLGPSPPTPDA